MINMIYNIANPVLHMLTLKEHQERFCFPISICPDGQS